MTTHHWYVYMVRCADNSLYTGVATDVERRVAEHNGLNNSKSGAKYTRSRQPVSLVYTETTNSRSAAAAREFTIKKLPRQKKEALISELI